jgi:hypothetical protein
LNGDKDAAEDTSCACVHLIEGAPPTHPHSDTNWPAHTAKQSEGEGHPSPPLIRVVELVDPPVGSLVEPLVEADDDVDVVVGEAVTLTSMHVVCECILVSVIECE